jgi:hypothetical protein
MEPFFGQLNYRFRLSRDPGPLGHEWAAGVVTRTIESREELFLEFWSMEVYVG